MKTLNTLLLTGLILAGTASISSAQFRTGTQEVAFSGSFTDNDNRVWNVAGYYGYFFNPQLQILAIGELQNRSGANTTGRIGPGIDWHFTNFDMDAFVPYVGGSYLIGLGSDTPDTLEGHVGIKQFVAENVAIKYQVGYGFDPSETSDSTFRATIGLSFFF